MASLGNQTGGFTFTISGSFGDVGGGSYTVPSPGIFVSDIKAICGNNGSSTTGRLYVWIDASGVPGAWLIRSGTFGLGGMGTQSRSDMNVNGGQLSADGYIPAGTKIWIGYFSSSGVSAFQGNGGGGTSELGNTNDGNFSNHGPAGGGVGEIAAWIDYTALGAPTLSSVSPSVAPAGNTVTLTGTGLLHTTGITVCGVTAGTFTITDDSHITLTIPAGASGSGSIVVTTPAGSASLAFVAGSLYADNGSAFVAGAIAYADNGTSWQQAQVWVDDGTTWHQVG